MKRAILIILCFVITAGLTAGCGKASDDPKKLSIVTTIFPEYDWVKQIMGTKADSADITLLLDSGVDLHSYQPTAVDIVKITSCDMFIYVGGESDGWVDDVLDNGKNEKMTVINLLDTLGDLAKEEEHVEGMQDSEDDDEDRHEETEYDEHVWLSLKNAVRFCTYITQKLCEIDPENKNVYTDNSKAYIDKLNLLDSQYAGAVSKAKTKTLLFGDRFPFRYLTDDYGLQYFAAFSGCSAESEASFETVVFLANKVDELGLKTIFKIENSDGRIADTIRNATKTKDQTVLTLDSMQSVTSKDVEKGVTYFSVMESNLAELKKAIDQENI